MPRTIGIIQNVIYSGDNLIHASLIRINRSTDESSVPICEDRVIQRWYLVSCRMILLKNEASALMDLNSPVRKISRRSIQWNPYSAE